ncbi:MAG: FtsX-like permease family protein [Chitinophagaceae bacterium]|nr:FtsX-like permease family protein [Chitinophagaceae bacterium]
MLRNYLKIALRNLFRHKAYSFINIAGLAIGMASSIIIFLWIQHEQSFDRFHTKAASIYRIIGRAGDFDFAVNPAGMPEGLQAELPAIRSTVRISHPQSATLAIGDKKFEEKKIFFVDSTFFRIFDFRLLKGNADQALQRSDAIVLTRSAAKKYFGAADPVGQVLRRDNKKDLVVTGILEDVPGNSHLQFDILIPLSHFTQDYRDLREKVWDNFDYYTYLLMDPGFPGDRASVATFNKAMDNIYKKHESEEVLKVNFFLQPLTSIHFNSTLQVDLPGHGNRQYVDIMLVVAVFILIIAAINFMNLATARSARRSREVGMRKVVGALRGQLVGQFLGESVVTTFLALLLAIGMVFLFLPLFNRIAGQEIYFNLGDWRMIGGLIGVAIITGLLAGVYPAFFLSAFRPTRVLKSNMKTMGGNLWFRNTLVVTQFVVSIVLLVGTVVVYKQLYFIKNRNAGFDKENLVYMPMKGDLWKQQAALKAELTGNEFTKNYSIISDLPIDLESGTVSVKWEGKDPKAMIVFPNMDVSEDFFDVFRMTILRGRSFSRSFVGDSASFILNEKAVATMGMTLDNAVGKKIEFQGENGMIIGVVKDFNYKPIQKAIEPMILRLNRWGGIVVVRTQPGKTENTIAALEKISRNLNPNFPFSYDFLDQGIANLYKGERRLSNLFNLFAGLAIFISCLGLYGLSAFLAEQRVREIGVRKVLGASVFGIVYLLSTGFTRLILIAMLIAVPLSWFAVNRWLESFAYHIEPGWLIFATACMAALLIAWITVSYESIKAALTSPVRSLRSE